MQFSRARRLSQQAPSDVPRIVPSDLHARSRMFGAGIDRDNSFARYPLARLRSAVLGHPTNRRPVSRNPGIREAPTSRQGRAIRALVLGRRNYLFAGSDAGGETAARLYSLVGTCRLNGLDPHLYLRHVLERIATHPINRLQELLPWRVADRLRAVALPSAA